VQGMQMRNASEEFCEMLGVWGKVFRKIRFASFCVFRGILAGRALKNES